MQQMDRPSSSSTTTRFPPIHKRRPISAGGIVEQQYGVSSNYNGNHNSKKKKKKKDIFSNNIEEEDNDDNIGTFLTSLPSPPLSVRSSKSSSSSSCTSYVNNENNLLLNEEIISSLTSLEKNLISPTTLRTKSSPSTSYLNRSNLSLLNNNTEQIMLNGEEDNLSICSDSKYFEIKRNEDLIVNNEFEEFRQSLQNLKQIIPDLIITEEQLIDEENNKENNSFMEDEEINEILNTDDSYLLGNYELDEKDNTNQFMDMIKELDIVNIMDMSTTSSTETTSFSEKKNSSAASDITVNTSGFSSVSMDILPNDEIEEQSVVSGFSNESNAVSTVISSSLNLNGNDESMDLSLVNNSSDFDKYNTNLNVSDVNGSTNNSVNNSSENLTKEEIMLNLENYIESIKNKKLIIETNEGETIEEPFVSVSFTGNEKSFGDLQLMAKSLNIGDIYDLPPHLFLQLSKANALNTEEAYRTISSDEPLDKAIIKIRKLDFILSQKEWKNKELSKIVKHITKEHTKEKESLKKKSLIKVVREGSAGNISSVNQSVTTNRSVLSSTSRSSSSRSKLRKGTSVTSGEDNKSKLIDYTIKLTDEEEERIKQLMLEDDNEDNITTDSNVIPQFISNEFLNRMNEIDNKLSQIIPPERRELFSLIETQYNHSLNNSINYSTTNSSLNISENPNKENNNKDYLREAREEREVKNKLIEIDERIAKLYNNQTTIENKLTSEMLEKLLKQAKEEEQALISK
ncbi:hypothetical protein ABK040_014582 [Willaertia magna]